MGLAPLANPLLNPVPDTCSGLTLTHPKGTFHGGFLTMLVEDGTLQAKLSEHALGEVPLYLIGRTRAVNSISAHELHLAL